MEGVLDPSVKSSLGAGTTVTYYGVGAKVQRQADSQTGQTQE